MNADYTLTCCSTVDLPADYLAARGIAWSGFHYTLLGKEYRDDLGAALPFPEFYRRIASDTEGHTAQPNISEYLALFTPILERGQDILHLCFSSGLSGAINSARNAALIAGEQFPERRICIVDSLGASTGSGLLLDAMADLRDAGASLDEVRAFAEENRLRVNHLFFSTNLSWYVRGGRVPRAAGLVGSLLGVCPMLFVDRAGRLVPNGKIRTKKRAIQELADRMERLADGGAAYSGKCFLSHSGCPEDAEAAAALLRERFPKLDGGVRVHWIGPTVGSHAGPGTVALFFWGCERTLQEQTDVIQ